MFVAIFFCIGLIYLKRSSVFGETLPHHAAQLADNNADLNADIIKKVLLDQLGAEEQDIDPAARREAFIDENAPFPFTDGRQVTAPTSGVLENARLMFMEVSAEILERWGWDYADTLFSGGMEFSDGSRLVQNKMLRAVIQQGGFVAAFTGISVTAGHDCLYEESYPVLLNETMGRLMAATGVRFEAINVAMGNTRSSPFSYCVDAHAGIDADIISWEMAMEVHNSKCGPAASAIELFIRSATVLPRQPAVLVMDASPDTGPRFCDGNNSFRDLKKRRREFMGVCGDEAHDKNLMDAYRKYGLHHIFTSTLVPTHACGDARFSRDKLYGEGKHYPKPMSWHPAPAGHRLVADILFMHYAEVFLRAVSRLEKVAPGWTATELRKQTFSSIHSLGVSLELWGDKNISKEAGGYATVYGSSGMFMGGGRGGILPRPRWCASWRFCYGAGNYRCANTYYPLAGSEGSRLLDMVSERTPVLSSRGKNYVVPPNTGHWSLTLNEEKPTILEYLKTDPPKGKHLPLDMKWVLVGNKASGPIEFKFETLGVPPSRAPEDVNGNATAAEGSAVAVDDSRVVVCKPDFIPRVRLNDPGGVRYSIDGVQTMAVRRLGHFGLNPGSCVLLAAEISVGRHTLTVEPLRDGQSYVAISHMIYPA